MKRSPMRRKSPAAIPLDVRDDVHRRSRGRCEGHIPGVCGGVGEHLHHVLLRARGGKHEASNLLHLCNACHGWVHANPEQATERGLMRHAWSGEAA